MKTRLWIPLLLSWPAWVFALPVHFPVPGGLAVLPLNIPSDEPMPTAKFNGVNRLVLPENGQWHVIAPLGLSQALGKQEITVTHEGKTSIIGFAVQGKQYEEQRLTIKNKRKVNPNAEDMQRITKERIIIRDAKRQWHDNLPDTDFILPTHGRYSSAFGLKRFFNDQPRNPHRGLDVAAPEGTDIHAAADGVVTAAQDFFFSGNVVFVDHGHGLVTMYAHMSRIDVKPGDAVTKGQVIGGVGETGRVTGPHLHWSVYLNSVAVDPNLFLTAEERHPDMRSL